MKLNSQECKKGGHKNQENLKELLQKKLGRCPENVPHSLEPDAFAMETTGTTGQGMGIPTNINFLAFIIMVMYRK